MTTAVWLPSSISVRSALFGTYDETAVKTGIGAWILTDGTLQTTVRKGSAPTVLNVSSTGTLNFNAWNIIGITIDEASGAGAGIWNINGVGETFDATYASPSAAAASYTMEIAACGNAGFQVIATNLTRMAAIAFVSAAFTEANHDAIFANLRGRFGI